MILVMVVSVKDATQPSFDLAKKWVVSSNNFTSYKSCKTTYGCILISNKRKQMFFIRHDNSCSQQQNSSNFFKKIVSERLHEHQNDFNTDPLDSISISIVYLRAKSIIHHVFYCGFKANFNTSAKITFYATSSEVKAMKSSLLLEPFCG